MTLRSAMGRAFTVSVLATASWFASTGCAATAEEQSPAPDSSEVVSEQPGSTEDNAEVAGTHRVYECDEAVYCGSYYMTQLAFCVPGNAAGELSNARCRNQYAAGISHCNALLTWCPQGVVQEQLEWVVCALSGYCV